MVSILGTSESRKLLTMTEDIEAAGGIMTRVRMLSLPFYLHSGVEK